MSTAPPPPIVTFTITAEDYTNALRLHMRRYWVSQPGPKLFIAAVLAACLLAAPLSGFHPVWNGVAIGGAIGAIVVPLLTYFLIIPGRARKIYAQQKTLRYPVAASWNGTAYSASTEAVSGSTLWSDYYGWSADQTMILLLPSAVLFQMLPRRALTPEQADDLFAQIAQSGLRRI